MKQSNGSGDMSLEMADSTLDQYEAFFARRPTSISNIRLTVLLLFVSFSFLLLTLPAVVINLVMLMKFPTRTTSWNSPWTTVDDNEDPETSPYYTIARLLMIMNHSTNFVFYFVVGKRFRRDLHKLCLDCWRRVC